jgi:protoporphyrinogen IX oxidase
MNYVYILGFHIMAMMSWMAVMFYLPRLYVYHTENLHNAGFVAVVKVQEYKLYKYIGLPSFWATIFSGAVLIYLNPSLLEQPWMVAKLCVLALLIGYSFSMEHYRLKLEQNDCVHNGQFFRAYNEVPTLLSILIVGYVIAKDTLPYFSVATVIFFGIIIYKIATLNENPAVSIKETE